MLSTSTLTVTAPATAVLALDSVGSLVASEVALLTLLRSFRTACILVCHVPKSTMLLALPLGPCVPPVPPVPLAGGSALGLLEALAPATAKLATRPLLRASTTTPPLAVNDPRVGTELSPSKLPSTACVSRCTMLAAIDTPTPVFSAEAIAPATANT